jgi:TetR/AcrR family transcriptional regulator, transcriptional repressor of bet genes
MKPEKLERPKTQPEINKFRRETLMAATLRVVAEQGIENTTIVKICDAANVSRGLANHYFASKDDLLVQAYQGLLDQVFEVTAKAAAKHRDKPQEQIKAMIESVFSKALFSEVSRAAYLCFWTASLSNKQLLEINRDVYDKEVRAMEKLFRRAAEERGKKIDARQVALSLISMMDGFWLSMSINTDSVTAKQAVGMCCNFVDMALA